MQLSTSPRARVRVGVSRCLLGHMVRYDGGHKLDAYIVQTLGRHLEFVAVCPEVECGLPVPREAMRLVADPAHPEAPRLMTQKTGQDHTDKMRAWMGPRLDALASEGLAGFIFKAKSPSSGMERIKVYPPGGQGMPRHDGVGLFARAFMDRFPLLPVEDDGRLHDPALREHFLERVFATLRWQEFLSGVPTLGALVDFHARHKLQLMLHSPKLLRELGALVAQAKGRPLDEVLRDYAALFFRVLAVKAGPRRHTNVLQHIQGYFKKDLSPDEKQESLELIAAHAEGQLPLVVPATLLLHFARKYAKDYLLAQTYLHPHPDDLRLRNTI